MSAKILKFETREKRDRDRRWSAWLEYLAREDERRAEAAKVYVPEPPDLEAEIGEGGDPLWCDDHGYYSGCDGLTGGYHG